MSKQRAVSIGGVDHTMEVGKFWFDYFYGKKTGQDPLNPSASTHESNFRSTVDIVYAGIETHCKVTGQTFSLTHDVIEKAVGDMDNDDVAELLEWFNEARKPKTKGEAEAQAEKS